MSNKAKPGFDVSIRRLTIFLFLVGSAALVLALGIDLLGAGGQSGIGLRQKLMLGVGISLISGGLLLSIPFIRERVRVRFTQFAGGASPALIPVVAVWAGLLTGIVEASYLGATKVILGKFLFRSIHFVWMTPAAYALLFGGLGILIALLVRRLPLRTGRQIGLLTIAFLSFASLATLFPKFSLYASLLLALGLAVQVSRLAVTHFPQFSWLVRFTHPILVGLVGLCFVTIFGWQIVSERQALSNLPPAANDAPNVILITMDTVRAENLSLYGYPRSTTPNLEQLAGQGVRFEQAYSTAPWTLPSHTGMFSGRWHSELQLDWIKSPATEHPLLTDALIQNGYRSAGFVANTEYCGWETNLDQGFSRYEDYVVSPTQILISPSLVRTILHKLGPILGENRLLMPKTAELVNDRFLKWVEKDPGRPFFAFLNYWDAHGPYQPPSPYDSLFGDPKQRANPLKVKQSLWSTEQIQAEIDAYDGGIAYLDAQIGNLYRELERRGIAENTLLIITSDHGELFGEHQLFGHSSSLYIPTLHVPFVMVFPGRISPGSSVAQPVSLSNLPVTVLDFLNLDNGLGFPGKSLAVDLHSQEKSNQSSSSNDLILSEIFPGSAYEEYSPLVHGEMKSLIIGKYHYILNGNGQEEIYDLESDYAENHNLVESGNAAFILDQFRESIKLVPQQVASLAR